MIGFVSLKNYFGSSYQGKPEVGDANEETPKPRQHGSGQRKDRGSGERRSGRTRSS